MADNSNFDQISALVEAFHDNIDEIFECDKELLQIFRQSATTQEGHAIIDLGTPYSLDTDAGTLAEGDLFHTIGLLEGAESYTTTAQRINRLDTIQDSMPANQLTKSAKEIVSNRAPNFAALIS